MALGPDFGPWRLYLFNWDEKEDHSVLVFAVAYCHRLCHVAGGRLYQQTQGRTI